ncbi:hypothetical protein CEB3_c05330 [Peptococcaceae bacterium CEB3]|nr:hypothetical protein CEB3_c05330 [Peptococcaceae bacterium CEB3]
MKKKHWMVSILALILGLAMLSPQNAWGMDNYTHDADISRDNAVVDPSFNGIAYNNEPYYVSLNWDGHPQYSNTTPVVVGSELYQYTYDADRGGYGHLWQIDLSKPQSGWELGGGVSLTAKPIAYFDEGTSGANGDVNNAAGISGPTIAQGYLAIAVGKYLYWWPLGHPDQVQDSPIRGNAGNDINLIAASPLITPPLTASGTDLTTDQPVTWQTPFAIVGSWSGGVISQPLDIPTNVSANKNVYQTTEDASNATNDIVTSSPAWDPVTTCVGGQGAAVFGVDAYQSGKYRLILMNPVTGEIDSIYKDQNGSPIFYGPIDSSPAIVTKAKFPSTPVADGTIVVPDQGAAIYELSANGSYMADNTMAMDQSNPCIANVALDGKNVIWVGNGHTSLNAAPLDQFNAQSSTKGPGYVGLNSPAVVNNGSSDIVFLASTGQDGLMITNPVSVTNPVALYNGVAKDTWQMLGSVSPAYTSVAADVGVDPTDGKTPLHYIATWTDAGLNSQGCVELWTPAPYGLTATAEPSVVNSGDKVFVNAIPNPLHVTKSMTAVVTAGGKTFPSIPLVQWNNQPDHENWLVVLTAPANYTGHQVKYTVTVTGTDNAGHVATATTYFLVNPIPLPPPGNLSGTLKIVAVRRSGATQPAGTAWYADQLATTLTVQTPPPPSGLLNATVTGWRITKAWVDTPQGVFEKNPFGPPHIARNKAKINMTLNGHTAFVKYRENWAGYPPPINEPQGYVMESDYIDAPFAVHVDYKYEVERSNKHGTYYVWETGSYDASGVASTNLDITGTEIYGFTKESDWVYAPIQGSVGSWEP